MRRPRIRIPLERLPNPRRRHYLTGRECLTAVALCWGAAALIVLWTNC